MKDLHRELSAKKILPGYNDDDEETETDDANIFVMEDEKEDFSGTKSSK